MAAQRVSAGDYVRITRTDGKTVEGAIQVSNKIGILLRGKGKTGAELIEPQDISTVDIVDDPNVLKQAPLQPTTLGKVRRHLADRHGLTLKEASALSENRAMGLHERLHDADDDRQINHYHTTEKE